LRDQLHLSRYIRRRGKGKLEPIRRSSLTPIGTVPSLGNAGTKA
jgi:hypothetical protein